MAEVERKRTLVNPARKRKRKNRKMSPKQIAHFGTKRQRAALRNARKRKRKNSRPVRTQHATRTNAAPRKRRASRRANRSHSRRRARRANPGGIIEVALNPASPRRKKVAAKKRTNRRRHHRRRRNPTYGQSASHASARGLARRARRPSLTRTRTNRRHHRRGHRRNPSIGGVSNLLVSAAYAIGGAIGSKYLVQMVLGSSNTGYVGYAANLAAGFVGGKAIGMFTHNKNAENGFILGAAIATLIRFLNDQTPLGATLQNAGLGDYEASTFLSPARYIDAQRSAAVDIPTALRMVAPAGVAGLRGLRGSGTYSRGRGTY